MRDEPILLVLDNFETNLKPQAEPGTAAEPLWACQDPAWDRCLTLLATELVGSPSRVLITCRRPLAALAGTTCHRVCLVRCRQARLRCICGSTLACAGWSSAAMQRNGPRHAPADASRFHPLLMDRLARLATGGPELRPQLMQALDALEKTHDFAQLPALFATGRGMPRNWPTWTTPSPPRSISSSAMPAPTPAGCCG